jgi:tRNA (guanosine-2'-O-)-methyltransferase
MRRTSPGVLGEEGLRPLRVRRAEAHDPKLVIAALEDFVTEERRSRMRAIFQARLESVTVLFDSPYDPHNGAAVIRSCDAFGVQALHVVERAEGFLVSDNVTRGAEKWVDLHCYRNPASALETLASQGFELCVADAEGELEPSDLRAIPRLCLVLGAERDGVSEALRSAASRRVRVPMRGFVESLNVSVTAAILLSHAVRGREGDLSAADQERLYARGLFLSVSRAEEVLAERVKSLL